MNVIFDDESGATYIELVRHAKVKKTVEISDLIMVDVDGDGEPVGVEFVMSPGQITDEMIKRVTNRFPQLGSLMPLDRSWLLADA